MTPLRNSVYGFRESRPATVLDLLLHPLFTNVVRLLLVVILSLGAYIWKVELAHLNRSLVEIKRSVDETLGRQQRELDSLKAQVLQTNAQVDTMLLRTNERLLGMLNVGKSERAADAIPPSNADSPRR